MTTTRPTRDRRRVRLLTAAAAASAVAGSTLAAVTVAAAAPAVADDDPAVPGPSAGAPFALYAPKEVTGYRWGRRVYVDLGLRAVAGQDPVEVRSHRDPSYEGPVTTTWTAGALSGTLPDRARFGRLPGFLTVRYRKLNGAVDRTSTKDGCLNGRSERVDPTAAATSPYPRGCPRGMPYTLGTVQGIEAGWATSLLGWGRGQKLPAGRYRVTSSIGEEYVQAFGLDPAQATHVTRLKVVKPGDGFRPDHGRAAEPADPPARPAPRPQGVGGADPATPKPDLRSLPAFDISLNRRGTQLRFAANVWNAGNSPLVIDGYRTADSDEMDAYQYFFDADDNQVGYERLDSHFHFHHANHDHWHYEDFARYRLLDRDRQPVRSSGKVSFCLANTDAIDYTVEGADWRPGNTDLSTACGQEGALSIRQVLSSGSGDTYAQFRAGQAIRVQGLPDGVYYLSVEANPFGKIVEQDTTNNQNLRWVRLTTRRDGTRLVRTRQVGDVVERGAGPLYRQPVLQGAR